MDEILNKNYQHALIDVTSSFSIYCKFLKIDHKTCSNEDAQKSTYYYVTSVIKGIMLSNNSLKY